MQSLLSFLKFWCIFICICILWYFILPVTKVIFTCSWNNYFHALMNSSDLLKPYQYLKFGVFKNYIRGISYLYFQCTLVILIPVWTKGTLNVLSEKWMMLFFACVLHLLFKHSSFFFLFSFLMNAVKCCECLQIFCELGMMPVFFFYFTTA